MKKRFFIILIFVLISSVFINTYYQSKKEYRAKFAFKISKINITPTKSLEVYDKNKLISFWNFSLRETDKIKVGDYLTLKVSRHTNARLDRFYKPRANQNFKFCLPGYSNCYLNVKKLLKINLRAFGFFYLK